MAIHPEEVIEVIMRKEMTYGAYLSMIEQAKKKGYSIQGYKIGAFQNGLSKEV